MEIHVLFDRLRHMRIRMPRLSIVLVLQAFFLTPASDAMDMPHYDLNSLVYMSTDIVIADLSEGAEHKFTATVTETLYGSLQPNDRLDTLTPFLIYFQPMEHRMSVVLFLDRRPHQYDFLHSDAAKSPFAVPPSGVYLIDAYQHVHEYFQMNNPGPYVAQGYSYFVEKTVPTKDQDLALPSLDEVKGRIAAAVRSVEHVRSLLDKVAEPSDAPALMKLANTMSASQSDCDLRMADAIHDRAVQQLHSLRDPDLLLRAYSVSSFSYLTLHAIDFIYAIPGNNDKEFTDARVRYLIQTLSNKKAELPLRVASLEILLPLAKFHSGPQSGSSKPRPIENEWLAGSATEIQTVSRGIFDDDSQNPELRGLSLQFLPLEQPEVVADVKRAYSRSRSGQLRFAIERAFLDVSDALYESLHPPGGPISSRVSAVPESGCAKRTPDRIVLQLDYQARLDFQEGNAVFARRPYAMVTSLSTDRHFILKDIHQVGGWRSFRDGQYVFELGSTSDLPAGNYSLSLEDGSGNKIISTSYALELSIRETPKGKDLSVKKSAEE
jgi:hypothetical protein